MHKPNCITKADLIEQLRILVDPKKLLEIRGVTEEYDRKTRVNIFDITNKDVGTLAKNLSADHLFQDEKVTSKAIRSKLKTSLMKASLSANKDYVMGIVNKLYSQGDASGRTSSMGLKMVIDTITGEINKANNKGVDLNSISNAAGVPYIPTHRLAASLGRQILYTQQRRVVKKEGTEEGAKKVEHMYYAVGMQALKMLEQQGFLTLHDPGKVTTVKDYMNEGDTHLDYKNPTTESVGAIELNVEALGVKNATGNSNDPILTQIRGTAEERIPRIRAKSNYDSLQGFLRAVELVSTPSNVSLPFTSLDERTRDDNVKDTYTMSDSAQETRKAIQDKPVFFDKGMFDFFRMLHEELKNSEDSASEWLKNIFKDNPVANMMFGFEEKVFVESDKASAAGRDLSKTTPINDVIEYFEELTGGSLTPTEMYRSLFTGRNTRVYGDNSVANPESSKFMRHAMAVKEYSYARNSLEGSYFLDKVSRELANNLKDDHNFAQVAKVLNGDITTESDENLVSKLDHLVELLNKFETADTPRKKLSAVSKMYRDFGGTDMAAMVTMARATRDYMQALDTGTITSTYMVSSDATASGGQLTLMQALGTNNEVAALLKALNIFKGNTDQSKTINDVYAILEKQLEYFFDPESRTDDDNEIYNPELESPDGDLGKVRDVLKSVMATLYNNKPRDLSKGPTMTFIYDQSHDGAVQSLAQEFTSKFIENYGKKSKQKELQEILRLLGMDDYKDQDIRKSNKFRIDMVNAFANTGAPSHLYNTLQSSLTDVYLKQYKERSNAVFAQLQDAGYEKIRVFPPSVVMDNLNPDRPTIEYTKKNLNKYGVPLTKVFEVAKQIGDDTVLTREERLQKTILNVSMIHSLDTANLLGAIGTLPTELDTGVITIHDDIRSNPALVMQAEQNYVEVNKQLGIHYDIHEQALLAADVYSGETLSKKVAYSKLLEQIQATKADKAKLIEDKKNGYDSETDSVIGDKKRYFTSPENNSEQSVSEAGSSNVQAEKPTERTTPEKAELPKLGLLVKNRLESLRGKSSIIDGFLSGNNVSKILSGNASSFDPTTDEIKLDGKLSDAKFIEEAEHEIVHAYTVATIEEHLESIGGVSNEMSYIEKSADRLSNLNLEDLSDLSDEAAGRIYYIIGQSTKKARMAEFIAVMVAEPKVASEIYKKLDSSGKTESVVKRVIDRIIKVLTSPSEIDVLDNNVDAQLLESSLNHVFLTGKSMRETNFDTFKILQQEFSSSLNYGGKREVTGPVSQVTSWIDAINESVSRQVVSRALRKGDTITGNIHRLLKTNSPAYYRVVRRAGKFYDDTPALQQVMHKITNGNVDKLKKNEVLSLFTKISADKESITSNELQRFKEAMKSVSDVDKKAFHEFSTQMSMADLFTYFPNGVKDVDAQISQIERDHFNSREVALIDRLVDFYVNDVITDKTPYNLEQAGYKGKQGKSELARQLVVLKSVKAIGPNRLRDLMKNTELMDVTRDNVMANEAILARNPNILTDQMRSNGIVEEYEQPVVFKAIDESQLKFYDEKNDWVVLREPSKYKTGIVYRKVIDSNFQSGVFTSLQMNASDIPVSKKHAGKTGVMKVGNQHKVVLTKAEKRKVGLIENPAQSIVRTMTTNLAIQDSNVIRQKLLEGESYYDINKDGVDKLVKIINSEENNPWFLNDINDRNYAKLPAKVRANYIRVPTKLSNVDNFDQRIKYVRKDISYWLVGNAEGSISNNKAVQVGLRVVKNLMSTTKIGMVILNPVKIAGDNLFNAVYLTTLGIDAGEMARSYNTIAKEFHEYKELHDRVIKLKVKAYADGKDYEKESAALVKRMEANPIHNVVKRGFSNSLASDIVLQSDNPNAGLKGDMDKLLTKIFKDSKGKNNKLAETILKVAKSDGISIEGFLEAVSGPFKVKGATKNIESELLRMSKRMEEIKSEDDIVGYMHQFLNSPDSEFVKLGTHMTDLTDILAKETYFRHLTKVKGMSEAQAEEAVITAFPDYKEGLPTAVQKLDSVGILMFPQYWMRMIQAMLRLGEKRPASFGSEMLIAQMMGTESQLWSQTIIEKSMSNWGLVHNPANHIGVGSVVPTNTGLL